MPTNLSLFSGAGGFDIGLKCAGFTTTQYVEADEKCRDTLLTNIHNPLLFKDVKIYKGQKIVRLHEQNHEKYGTPQMCANYI